MDYAGQREIWLDEIHGEIEREHQRRRDLEDERDTERWSCYAQQEINTEIGRRETEGLATADELAGCRIGCNITVDSRRLHAEYDCGCSCHQAARMAVDSEMPF